MLESECQQPLSAQLQDLVSIDSKRDVLNVMMVLEVIILHSFDFKKTLLQMLRYCVNEARYCRFCL